MFGPRHIVSSPPIKGNFVPRGDRYGEPALKDCKIIAHRTTSASITSLPRSLRRLLATQKDKLCKGEEEKKTGRPHLRREPKLARTRSYNAKGLKSTPCL